MRRTAAVLLSLLVSNVAAQDSRPAAPQFAFQATWPASAYDGAFSGRVVVFVSKAGARENEPRRGPNWFDPGPMFGAEFKDRRPGDAMKLDASNWTPFIPGTAGFAAGDYVVQAVMDRNLGGRAIGRSPGNLYSAPLKVALDPAAKALIELVCDQIAVEPAFKETDRVKEMRVPSKLLSDFYGRPVTINGAVLLPRSWAAEAERRFPVIYEVPGFGGTHHGMSGSTLEGGRRGDPTRRAEAEFIHVVLDPSCPGGHSVFADSANNGPWGEALTTEFIPACESKFRGAGLAAERFVTGHSSGGWSSLWLQVAYPDLFGGCWSTAPDPVDFRDFQRIDIYAEGENMFLDRAGQERALARTGGEVRIRYRQFSDMERPIRGEQLGSFEWAFSPRGKDGAPRPLWNRDTGAIDRATAEAWKPYDIGHVLRTRWKELAPKLDGKIRVYMGTEDTFYLEGATKLLKGDLSAMGSNAVVELFPGDHGSFMNAALRKRIDEEMAAQLPPKAK